MDHLKDNDHQHRIAKINRLLCNHPLSLKEKSRSEESVRRSSQSSHEKNEPLIFKKLPNEKFFYCTVKMPLLFYQIMMRICRNCYFGEKAACHNRNPFCEMALQVAMSVPQAALTKKSPLRTGG